MNIKDYLPYYIGQKYRYYYAGVWTDWHKFAPYRYSQLFDDDIDQIQLALRRLEDLTEAEMNECGNLDYDFSGDPWLNEWDYTNFNCMLTPNQFHWLLQHGFDLFDLIPAGLAVDVKTIS